MNIFPCNSSAEKAKTEFPFFHHIQKRKRQFFENENQCPYIINVPRPFLVCPLVYFSHATNKLWVPSTTSGQFHEALQCILPMYYPLQLTALSMNDFICDDS